jgi:hypothetical protein
MMNAEELDANIIIHCCPVKIKTCVRQERIGSRITDVQKVVVMG